uniref:Uncharacterized protein n=1 Tax=Ascaris lumbricoides TaxID=6252 RepID=A0A9J2P3L1_ASCLU
MAVSGFFGFFALILYLNILSGTTGTADSQHIMLSLCFCHLRAKYLSSFAYYAVRAFVLLNADSPSVDDIAAKSSRKDEISAIVRKRLQLALYLKEETRTLGFLLLRDEQVVSMTANGPSPKDNHCAKLPKQLARTPWWRWSGNVEDAVRLCSASTNATHADTSIRIFLMLCMCMCCFCSLPHSGVSDLNKSITTIFLVPRKF